MMPNLALVGTVLVLLGAATGVGQWLRRQRVAALDRRAVESFNARIQAWWFFDGRHRRWRFSARAHGAAVRG